jgi:AhpD family alkylhydroperoxidase
MIAAKHLDARTKILIAVGISVSIKCPYCVSYYVNESLKMKISRAEVIDAAMVGVGLGGGATMTYVTMVVKALDELSQ